LFLELVDSFTVSTPPFPESVKDGTIRLLKKVGDKIAVDETIAEIETDKSNLSVNSPQAGIIETLLVADGDNVTSGAQVAKLNTSGGGGGGESKPKPTPAGSLRNFSSKKKHFILLNSSRK
jgi:2-oxoglutarate dehydrogenase E2 component (dihydrolipoamide succinyltransferase)